MHVTPTGPASKSQACFDRAHWCNDTQFGNSSHCTEQKQGDGKTLAHWCNDMQFQHCTEVATRCNLHSHCREHMDCQRDELTHNNTAAFSLSASTAPSDLIPLSIHPTLSALGQHSVTHEEGSCGLCHLTRCSWPMGRVEWWPSTKTAFGQSGRFTAHETRRNMLK